MKKTGYHIGSQLVGGSVGQWLRAIRKRSQVESRHTLM